MRKINLIIAFMTTVVLALHAREPERTSGSTTYTPPTNPSGLRNNCAAATANKELGVNNVRAFLRQGGGMWTINRSARYIVPYTDKKTIQSQPSSLYAGAIWLGAKTSGGNLIVAARDFFSNGKDDFWPGPLVRTGGDGTTNKERCASWDKIFEVDGAEIRNVKTQYETQGGVSNIPDNIKYWPASGNSLAGEFHSLDMAGFGTVTDHALAPFFDENNDGIYNPVNGDYPLVEVSGCSVDRFGSQPIPDKMMWWVYNDAGNIHSLSKGAPMNMEVQCTAFAYKTTDALNDMTFYRYKLINQRASIVDSTFFANWADPDLGNPTDDYMACDTTSIPILKKTARGTDTLVYRARDLGIIYNADALDQNSPEAPTFGANIPALGIDYFRGPLNDKGEEIGLSYFMYYKNAGGATGDPSTPDNFYNYMQAKWPDGSQLQRGGNGYNSGGPTTRYAFPLGKNGSLTEPGAWTMCNNQSENPPGDFRFLHVSGPFKLNPGATNELIVGIPWVANHITGTACSPLTTLLEADDLAQSLFDNCFKLIQGPDAPDMDIVELNKELLFNFSFKPKGGLAYKELNPKASGSADKFYNYQGFKVYQLTKPSANIDNPNEAVIVFQCDVKDSISRIVNYTLKNGVFIPTVEYDGPNDGLKMNFILRQDAFSTSNDKSLINHKKYYFKAVSFGYNNYKPFDATAGAGQNVAYLLGKNSFSGVGIPRNTLPEYGGLVLNSTYDESIPVTRISGTGNSGSFLDLLNQKKFEEELFAKTFVKNIAYSSKGGPVDIKVVNPMRIQSDSFVLRIFDTDTTDNQIDMPELKPSLLTNALSANTGSPTGWVFNNAVTTKPISQIGHWLLEPAANGDKMTTAPVDLTSFARATLSFEIAGDVNGTNFNQPNRAIIEISDDGGTTFKQQTTSSQPVVTNPASPTYVVDAVAISSLKGPVVVRISNIGSSKTASADARKDSFFVKVPAADALKFRIGEPLVGTSIAPNTTITAINTASGEIRLSNRVTVTNTQSTIAVVNTGNGVRITKLKIEGVAITNNGLGSEGTNPSFLDTIKWSLQKVGGTGVNTWISPYTLRHNYNHVIPDLGISIRAFQNMQPGCSTEADPTGFLGVELEYEDPSKQWYAGLKSVQSLSLAPSPLNSLFNFTQTNSGQNEFNADPRGAYIKNNDYGWYPAVLNPCRELTSTSGTVTETFPVFSPLPIENAYCDFVKNKGDKAKLCNLSKDLRNVNVVFTSDKSKWSRCVVVETASKYQLERGMTTSQRYNAAIRANPQMSLRSAPSVDVNGSPDNSGTTGMGWFPGYAYDVTTGERLNIFFGENTILAPNSGPWVNSTIGPPAKANGADMMFNPSDQLFVDWNGNQLPASADINGVLNIFAGNDAGEVTNFVLGGGHHIYVCKSPYDECKRIYEEDFNTFPLTVPATDFATRLALIRRRVLSEIIWTSTAIMAPNTNMDNGNVPSKLTVKLRVKKPFDAVAGQTSDKGFPAYGFSTKALAPQFQNATSAKTALDLINIVPNPYYAANSYEESANSTFVRVTNLPANCSVSIYGVDGRLIRTYKQNLPIRTSTDSKVNIDALNIEAQNLTSIDWDMRNLSGVPVSSGVYLVKVAVPGVGERTLKSVIVTRAYDSQKL